MMRCVAAIMLAPAPVLWFLCMQSLFLQECKIRILDSDKLQASKSLQVMSTTLLVTHTVMFQQVPEDMRSTQHMS